MKRMKLILPILLLLIVGCDEDATSPDDACVELTTSYSDAATEFGTDMTMVNCEAQYAALGAWCDGDCEPSDTAEEDAICSDMSDLDSASITAMCELLLDIADEGDSSDSDDEDAPPECASDCAGYDSMKGEDETDDYDVWCGWLSTWSTEGCLSDCTADELEENAEVLFLVEVCTECLENDNCEEVIDHEEEDGDDDFPECFLDCDLSIFLSPTATCEFFGGDDISCTDDCTGDDAAMLTLYPIMCGTCVEDGDCDDLFDDEDGEGEDGDDAPPECASDCDGYDSMIGEDETDDYDVWCGWLSTWSTDGCLSDCTADELEEADILEVVEVCTECLANDNCEYVLDGDDECDVCHDDCDDDDACHDACEQDYCEDDDGGEETDCQALGETLIELIDADFGGAADGDTCDAMCDAAVAAAQALVDNSCDWPEGGDGDMPTGAALQEDVDGMAAGFCGPYGVCGGSGEDDDGDDDFPECFLDCDLSIFLSPTATCEFFGGDDISCTDDCTGDAAAIITLYPIMCGTCVEDGNCDDLFGDDGE